MLTETQKGSWQRRLMIFEHLCKENNIEVTDFMKEDFVRIMEELQEYDAKIHTDSTDYWSKTKKVVFDVTNIFLASKEYLELRDKYKYLKISTKDFTDESNINLVPEEKLMFKKIIPYDFWDSVIITFSDKYKIIIPFLYCLIEYSINFKISKPETKSIIVNIYDFISYLININEKKGE